MKKTNLIFTIMILMFAVGLQAGIKFRYLSSGNTIDGKSTTASLGLDIDKDGNDDLTLSVPTANDIKLGAIGAKAVRFFVKKAGTGATGTEGEDNILVLAANTSLTHNYSTGGVFNTGGYSFINSAGHNGGAAFTTGDQFIGFTFEITTGNVHAGWMQVSLADNVLTIKRIAYEETKETAIPIVFVPVTTVTVSAAGSATTLARGATLQMSATVSSGSSTTPTSNEIIWSTTGGTGFSIVASGILTAETTATGTVTVTATATDGSGVYGMKTIDAIDAVAILTGVTISGTLTTGTTGTVVTGTTSKVASITSNAGKLSLTVTNAPSGVTEIASTVWASTMPSVVKVTNTLGIVIVEGIKNGTAKISVTVTQTASPNNIIKTDTVLITVSGQTTVEITGGNLTTANRFDSIKTNLAELQLTSKIEPTGVSVEKFWTSSENTIATVSQTGLVKAVSNGITKISLTVKQGASIRTDIVEIRISGQLKNVTKIVVDGPGGDTIIEKMKDSLLMSATITPTDAANKEVKWSVDRSKTFFYDVNATTNTDYEFKNTETEASMGKDTTFTAKIGDKLYFFIDNGIVSAHPFLIKSKVSAGFADTLKISEGVKGNGTSMVTFMPKSVDTFYYVCKNHIAMTGKIIVLAADPVIATIDQKGMLKANGTGNGIVTVMATAKDGTNTIGAKRVEIKNQNQIKNVTKIVVDGPDGDTIIEKMKDSLQMKAVVTPTDAANDTVMWSLKGGPKTYKYDVDADGNTAYEFKDTQAGVAFGKDTTFTVKVGDKLYFKMEDKIGSDHPFLIKSKVSAGYADTLKVSDGVTGNGKAMVTFMPKIVDTFYYVCKNHIAMTGKIIVSAADPVIATIDQKGMLKANGKGDGTVTVMATAKDASKTVGTKKVIIKNQTLTVFDIDGVDNITVYPNPTTEVLNIKGKTEERYESVTIYSLDGKVVLNETVTGTTHSMNINRLNTGAYLLRVVSENGNIYTKNIIKK